MLAFKAPAYVAAIATLLLAAISLSSAFSNHQPAVTSWLFLASTTLVNFVVMFLVGLLPMPVAALFRTYRPATHVAVRFALSLAFGMLMVFLILWLIETPVYESDGASSVYRHAGPSVAASTKLLYYVSAAPILVLALFTYHWLERAAARRANKSMQATCEDARA